MKNIVIGILSTLVVILGYINLTRMSNSPSISQTANELSKAKESKVTEKTHTAHTSSETNLVKKPSSELKEIEKLETICIEQSSSDIGCTIDTSIDIEERLVDVSKNLAKLDAISELLKSDNFQEVASIISSSKITEQARVKENKFNHQLNDFINNNYTSVSSDGVHCGDSICTVTITYNSLDDWSNFNAEFFNHKEKGNIFINNKNEKDEVLKTAKVVFMPEGKGIQSSKKVVDL
ncbi:hypothetical protein AADZ86_18875 [Colwelliaceae bacterium BS250]